MTSNTMMVALTNPEGARRTAAIDIRKWERKDAVRKGGQWGGIIAGVGVAMVPIPIIHFFSPIVLLVMAPLGGFLIFRMYNGGSDLHGTAECPSCSQTLELAGSADRWPVQKICPHCKRSVSVIPAETP